MHKMVLYGIRLVGAGVATLWTNESGEHWLKVMMMRWRLDWRFVLRNYPASCQQDFHLCPGSESELWLHQPSLECKIAQQRGGVLGQISPACWHCIQSPTSNLTQTWHQFFTRLSNPFTGTQCKLDVTQINTRASATIMSQNMSLEIEN